MEAEKKLKKSVKVRLKKEELKKFKEENAGQLGPVKSSLKNIPTSPRKMRLVADMIRGQRVNYALNCIEIRYSRSLLPDREVIVDSHRRLAGSQRRCED